MIVSNRHWRRLYSVVNAQASRLAFGIDAGTAVEFGAGLTARRVVGDSAAVVLDGQYATFGTGSTAHGQLTGWYVDTFVDGGVRMTQTRAIGVPGWRKSNQSPRGQLRTRTR